MCKVRSAIQHSLASDSARWHQSGQRGDASFNVSSRKVLTIVPTRESTERKWDPGDEALSASALGRAARRAACVPPCSSPRMGAGRVVVAAIALAKPQRQGEGGLDKQSPRLSNEAPWHSPGWERENTGFWCRKCHTHVRPRPLVGACIRQLAAPATNLEPR